LITALFITVECFYVFLEGNGQLHVPFWPFCLLILYCGAAIIVFVLELNDDDDDGDDDDFGKISKTRHSATDSARWYSSLTLSEKTKHNHV